MNNVNASELEQLRGSKIYVAGHRGMVGSAIVRRLEEMGHRELVLRTREELDLIDPHQVDAFMQSERPDFVFLAEKEMATRAKRSSS